MDYDPVTHGPLPFGNGVSTSDTGVVVWPDGNFVPSSRVLKFSREEGNSGARRTYTRDGNGHSDNMEIVKPPASGVHYKVKYYDQVPSHGLASLNEDKAKHQISLRLS